MKLRKQSKDNVRFLSIVLVGVLSWTFVFLKSLFRRLLGTCLENKSNVISVWLPDKTRN